MGDFLSQPPSGDDEVSVAAEELENCKHADEPEEVVDDVTVIDLAE
jgi:tRNA threonylcarbamoyladenosine modification (KEOPS) complex Cgi121 subunit